ncbi:VapE domain-containing protein [Microvirga massiliensis]|uniref:VapE domain-containing protein n=1 Tax=Microvirga massiliensis TaxID=1033741 RepID=UPI00062B82ED|nr:VapE domain-containing protein [Microvirga massiliensis]
MSTNTQKDTTLDFEKLIQDWQNLPPGHVVTTAELAELLLAAETAITAASYLWAEMIQVLIAHGGLKKEQAAKELVRACRVKADLGMMPHDVWTFIPAFLGSRGYDMNYSGAFTLHGKAGMHDRDYIGKQMKIWNVEVGLCPAQAIDWGLDNWMVDQQEKLRREVAQKLRFDPAIDPDQTELKRFVCMMIPAQATPQQSEKVWKAAEIAFATFIYRAKNHVRYVWKNSAHLMPILFGTQGDGKSEAIKTLCEPLRQAGMFASVGFDAFDDNDQSYQLSLMPVWLFEEMQGISKADISKLKAIMTDSERQMRAAYGRTGVKQIITTFIACTNEDTAEKIRDSSGNRRFIQFETQPVDRALIHSIDAEKIWRSVDEDAAEPPMYATPENAALIKEIQLRQRYLSPVEHWLMDCPNIPWGTSLKATGWWEGHGACLSADDYGFHDWLKAHYGANEVNQWSAVKLGYALKDLSKRYDIEVVPYGGSNKYAIMKPKGLVEDDAAGGDSGVVDLSEGRTRYRKVS